MDLYKALKKDSELNSSKKNSPTLNKRLKKRAKSKDFVSMNKIKFHNTLRKRK